MCSRSSMIAGAVREVSQATDRPGRRRRGGVLRGLRRAAFRPRGRRRCGRQQRVAIGVSGEVRPRMISERRRHLGERRVDRNRDGQFGDLSGDAGSGDRLASWTAGTASSRGSLFLRGRRRRGRAAGARMRTRHDRVGSRSRRRVGGVQRQKRERTGGHPPQSCSDRQVERFEHGRGEARQSQSSTPRRAPSGSAASWRTRSATSVRLASGSAIACTPSTAPAALECLGR